VVDRQRQRLYAVVLEVSTQLVRERGLAAARGTSNRNHPDAVRRRPRAHQRSNFSKLLLLAELGAANKDGIQVIATLSCPRVLCLLHKRVSSSERTRVCRQRKPVATKGAKLSPAECGIVGVEERITVAACCLLLFAAASSLAAAYMLLHVAMQMKALGRHLLSLSIFCSLCRELLSPMNTQAL